MQRLVVYDGISDVSHQALCFGGLVVCYVTATYRAAPEPV